MDRFFLGALVVTVLTGCAMYTFAMGRIGGPINAIEERNAAQQAQLCQIDSSFCA